MIVVPDRGYIPVMASDDSAASKQQPLLVLGKITEILDAFTLAHPDMTLGEIQQATGLPTSTVQRLVSNMVAQGLLDRKGDRIRVGVRMSTRCSRRSATRPVRPPASSRWSKTSGCVLRSQRLATRYVETCTWAR
jgi:hypothetical protein